MVLENTEECINCSGMGILKVEEKLKDFASRGNIGELTVESSDGGHWHSYFNVEDWKDFKDSVNTHAAITKVWIKEIPSRLTESTQLKEFDIPYEVYKDVAYFGMLFI